MNKLKKIDKDNELFVSYNTIIKCIERDDVEYLLRYCMLKNIVVGIGEQKDEQILFHPKGYILDTSNNLFKVLKLQDGVLVEEFNTNKLASFYIMFLSYKTRLDYSYKKGNRYVINYR